MKEMERQLSPDEQPHKGEPIIPRPAATIVLMRGGSTALEVLMVQRHHAASFMGGVWVFPGGAVDAEDGFDALGIRTAAVRELREETGIQLSGPDMLVPYARWITPRESRKRFDTWFFLAAAPSEYQLRLSAQELIDHRWIRPADALSAQSRGELLLVFPTIRTLQSLNAYPSAAAAVSASVAREIVPQEPRAVHTDGGIQIMLPGDHGYPGT